MTSSQSAHHLSPLLPHPPTPGMTSPPSLPSPTLPSTSSSSSSALSSAPTDTASVLSHFPLITTRSQHMLRILGEAQKFAQSSSCILIQGESGTGKEMMAQSMHLLSSRKNHHFITVNCSAISEGLLESELFGHIKGAFTGANRHKEGFFAKAHNGTLFLDEIGDMPLRLQAKLLRVLQNQAYHQVGSTDLTKTNVRIIAATNVDLNEAVKKRKFRLDLYYRLNVLPIEMPPLRRRTEDIELLIQRFLHHSSRLHHQPLLSFDPHCLQRLMHYAWPGNIRELENLIKRLIITKHEGTVQLHDLPPKYRQEEVLSLGKREGASQYDTQRPSLSLFSSHPPQSPPSSPQSLSPSSEASPLFAPTNNASLSSYPLREILDHIVIPEEGINLTNDLRLLERHLIHRALSMTQDNKNQAAALLGIKRTTLLEKIRRNNITFKPTTSPP